MRKSYLSANLMFSDLPTTFFPEYMKSFLESSIVSQKFSEDLTFKKARLLGMEFCNKKCMSHKTSKKLRIEISNLNNIHFSKLKHKLQFLCNNSR